MDQRTDLGIQLLRISRALHCSAGDAYMFFQQVKKNRPDLTLEEFSAAVAAIQPGNVTPEKILDQLGVLSPEIQHRTNTGRPRPDLNSHSRFDRQTSSPTQKQPSENGRRVSRVTRTAPEPETRNNPPVPPAPIIRASGPANAAPSPGAGSLAPSPDADGLLLVKLSRALGCSAGAAYSFFQEVRNYRKEITISEILAAVETFRPGTCTPKRILEVLDIEGRKITWNEVDNASNHKRVSRNQPIDRDIEWTSKKTQRYDISYWIGIEDAFDHTQFVPGEKIMICSYDDLAYHLSTWEYLKINNRGKCFSCDRDDTFVSFVLPTEKEVVSSLASRISYSPEKQATPKKKGLLQTIFRFFGIEFGSPNS